LQLDRELQLSFDGFFRFVRASSLRNKKSVQFFGNAFDEGPVVEIL